MHVGSFSNQKNEYYHREKLTRFKTKNLVYLLTERGKGGVIGRWDSKIYMFFQVYDCREIIFKKVNF